MGETYTAAERADRMVTGQPWHPFDFHNNPICYDPAPEPGLDYTRRLIEQTKVAYIAANEASANLSFAFLPCSMSNGWLAYELAEDYAHTLKAATQAKTGEAFLTTQNLKTYVAPAELLNRVILPNRLANQALLDQAEKRFPDFALIGPVDFEGPIRSTRTDHALSQGATFQDWTFESWWLPRVSDCDRIILAGDHAYSRYANVEELLGDLVQCGIYHDLRNGRQMDITDLNGHAVPLCDRAWERAKHIVNVVERGFRTDLAAMVLMAQFQLHDWLQNENGPLDRSRIHPALLNRSRADVARMEKLKNLMLPYLADKCLGWTPWQQDPNVKAFCEAQVLPQAGKGRDIAEVQKALFSYQPKGGFIYPPETIAKALGSQPANQGAFTGSATPKLNTRRAGIATAKRRGTEGDYFGAQWGAEIFEDNLFDRLSTWEKAALPFLLGSMEAHRLPENNARAAFYSCDAKGGTIARDWLDTRGLAWVKEAKTKEFAREVIKPTMARDAAAIDSLRHDGCMAGQHIKNVVSTHNILNIDAAVERRRIFVAASGPDRLTSSARLALQMKWLDRNADMLVVRPGWEIAADDAQLVVRGMLLATGLIERPAQSAYQMQIVTDTGIGHGTERLQKQDLGDLILALAPQLNKWLSLDDPPPARELYVAAARLLHILDMYVDPGRMNIAREKNGKTGGVTAHTVIAWDKVDSDLTWFYHGAPEKKASVVDAARTLRQLLLDKGVLYMEQADLNDLHEDYHAAWIKTHVGSNLADKRDFAGGRTFIEHRRIA